MKDSFERIILSSKRKLNLIESDGGKEFYTNFFQDFLNRNNIKTYSRNTSLGAVFAKDLFVLIEICLKDLFLNEVMLIGSDRYLTYNNKTI